MLGSYPQRRYFPTPAGIRALADDEAEAQRPLRVYPVSKQWLRLLAERLDAIAGQAAPIRRQCWDELAIDRAGQEVSPAGRWPCDLPGAAVLVELSKHAGQVLSHAELLPGVWARPAPGAGRTLDKLLREELGNDAENPTYILSVPRLGHRMPEPDTRGKTTSPGGRALMRACVSRPEPIR